MFGLFETPVSIQTSLPRTVLVARLRDFIPEPTILGRLFGSAGLIGRVKADRCWIDDVTRFTRSYRRLTLRFIDSPDGTKLEGKFDFPWDKQIVLGIGLSVSMYWSVSFLVHDSNPVVSGNGRPSILSFAPLLVVLGLLALVKLSLLFRVTQERDLVQQIIDLSER